MSTFRYTSDHEWVRDEADSEILTVGITDFAQSQLGDVVYVELPEIGAEFEQGQEAGVVESVKAASEIYAPLDGEVVEINEALQEDPGLVNTSPLDEGWFFRLRAADPDQLGQLLTEAQYQAEIEEA